MKPAVTFLLLFPAFVSAADISLSLKHSSAECPAIRVEGEITPGDAARLRSLVEKRTCSSSGLDQVVAFNSGGGDVDEAILIGRIIREAGLTTAIHRDDNCLSACGLAFVGGVYRFSSGRFGVHRPFALEMSRNSQQAESRWRLISTKISSYLREMRISESYFDLMIRVSPQNVVYLDAERLASLGIIGADPVYEDIALSREAERYGVSKRQFIERKALVKSLCPGLRPFPYDPCTDRVIRHGR